VFGRSYLAGLISTCNSIVQHVAYAKACRGFLDDLLASGCEFPGRVVLASRSSCADDPSASAPIADSGCVCNLVFTEKTAARSGTHGRLALSQPYVVVGVGKVELPISGPARADENVVAVDMADEALLATTCSTWVMPFMPQRRKRAGHSDRSGAGGVEVAPRGRSWRTSERLVHQPLRRGE